MATRSINAGLEKSARAALPAGRNRLPAGSNLFFDRLTKERGHEFQNLLAFSALRDKLLRDHTRREAANVTQGKSSLASVETADQQSNFSLEDVLQLVAERGLQITGADGLAIALAGKNDVAVRAQAGELRPDVGEPIDDQASFSIACLRTAQILRCQDTETDSRVNLQACRGLGARSLIAVPLRSGHGVIGVLEVFSKELCGFDDGDVSRLSQLADLIKVALKPEDEERMALSAQIAVADSQALKASARESVTDALGARLQAQTTDTVTLEPDHAETRLSPGVGPTSRELSPDVPPIPEVDGNVSFMLDLGRPRAYRPGRLIFVCSIVIVAGLLIGFRWKLRSAPTPVTAGTTATLPISPALPRLAVENRNAAAVAGNTALTAPLRPAGALGTSPTARFESSGFPRVTGIRHWSDASSTTVVIDFEKAVLYRAHRLPEPERIFFDLMDTKLDHALAGKSSEVNDSLLSRIRVAQTVPGVTRVVLETNGKAGFSVTRQLNPSGLRIELRNNAPPKH
jgi:GAF domain/AMIN domain